MLQVLTGSGALAGDALAGHSGVDGVVLTGGVPTGKAVMAKASEQLTPVTLELGGKGANIVFSDANSALCGQSGLLWYLHECRADVLGWLPFACP